MAAPPPSNGQPRFEEAVPPLNTYVRSRLAKSEGLTFAACASALANLPAADNEGSKELVSKVLPRMVLFEALPPAVLPVLLSVRAMLDLPKTGDRKLLRIVNYLIQLAAGEGSAGTVVPFSTLTGGAVPICATDQFEYEDLSKLWADVLEEHATIYQRSAAFRTLAAAARSSMTTDADDTTLVAHLMAAAATTLDRVEAAKRGKLPFFGSSKKGREMDRRQTLERVAVQRLVLSSARVGLPRVVLSMKIAPRAFPGINSVDSLCARHALALAALLARDNPAMYSEQVARLLAGNLEVFQSTGSLSASDDAAAVAAPPGAAADAVAAGGGAPLRPAREVFQERSINLNDPWARVYLARGCGALLQAAGGRGGAAEVYWRALTICACCDKSTIVTLEAIKALSGAPYPTSLRLRPSATSAQRLPALDEKKELEDGISLTAGWRMLLANGDEEVPGAVPQMHALAAFAKQFSATRSQRGVQQSASLKRLANFGGADQSSEESTPSSSSPPGTILAVIVQRLLACLAQMSHALVCSTTRAVAVLAEARGRAVAAARSPEEKAALLGDGQVQGLMRRLEQRMRAIASDPEFSAHQRVKALEALLWFQPLPARACSGLTPVDLVQWMSTGGGTVSRVVAAVFADPWPEDCIAAFLATMMRRLYSCPGAAEYLLSLSTAIASVCPSRVRMEQLQQMWDTCLRANNTDVKVAAIQAALELLSPALPPICCPPSAAAPEVKALASREEAARWAHTRASAWWLGENINFAANEFAWQQRLPPGGMVASLMRADTTEAGQLASAAAASNPLLSMALARLQRAVLGGCWEVRMAAVQAIAKIAVRSGEPFRVQAYSILASTRASSSSTSNGSSAALSGSGQGSGGVQRLVAGLPQVSDPLGVAAAVGPALEVLDAMYAGEVVVEELISKYGRNRKKWPKKLLKTLTTRNAALCAVVCERVCFVPKELFWALGDTAKQLLTGRIELTEEELEEKRKKREAKAAEAAKKGAAGSTAGASSEEEEEEEAAAADEEAGSEKGSYRHYAVDSSDVSAATSPRHGMLDKLQGYDYNPNDDAYSVLGSQAGDFPDSVSMVGEQVPSDDDSVVHRQQGTVLYDFSPEEADEVAVRKGDQVEVEYEMGGWLHIITSNGSAGLVPRSYVHIREEDEDTSDVLSLAGQSSMSGSSVAGYSGFRERSDMRLKTRTSDAGSSLPDSPYRARSGTAAWRDRGAGGAGHEEEDEEEVAGDPMLVAEQMGRVNQEHAEVERAADQVEEMASEMRGGGMFNQPQYLHLKEQLNRSMQHLEAMQVSSAARQLRRQVEQRALAALDQLEALRRIAMGGAPGGGSPSATPRALSLRERQPSISGSVASGGGYEGAGEVYEYTPSLANVAYDFTAEAEGEVSVAVGDVVWVEAEVDGWYSVRRERDGARGLVPASYVELEGFN